MSKNDGGPAFPNPALADPNFALRTDMFGMTLRDYFAGQALAGMGTWMPAYAGRQGLDHSVALNARARWAYDQADAMLAARRLKPASSSEEE